jgi:hypothetical protein
MMAETPADVPVEGIIDCTRWPPSRLSLHPTTGAEVSAHEATDVRRQRTAHP